MFYSLMSNSMVSMVTSGRILVQHLLPFFYPTHSFWDPLWASSTSLWYWYTSSLLSLRVTYLVNIMQYCQFSVTTTVAGSTKNEISSKPAPHWMFICSGWQGLAQTTTICTTICILQNLSKTFVSLFWALWDWVQDWFSSLQVEATSIYFGSSYLSCFITK